MDAENVPTLTDKQRKNLAISATAFRPTEGLELSGSRQGYRVRGIDMKNHSPYGEWSLEISREGATVNASLRNHKQTWHGTFEDLRREWSRIILGLMHWQKAINMIELYNRAREDPTLWHIAPSTISDPATYRILGGPEW